MKKENLKRMIAAVSFFTAFVLWTCAVCFFDVRPIGVLGTKVGFAFLNGEFHHLTGVHMSLYALTDLLSLIPLGFVLFFGSLGVWQTFLRKSLLRVDRSLIVLGFFYVTVAAFFLFFEMCVINVRPILIEGRMEASYPSSTTLLVLTVMPTALMQLNARMKKSAFRTCVLALLSFFTVFMVVSRLLSGVHWLSDIIGGGLLSVSLVFAYSAFSR